MPVSMLAMKLSVYIFGNFCGLYTAKVGKTYQSMSQEAEKRSDFLLT